MHAETPGSFKQASVQGVLDGKKNSSPTNVQMLTPQMTSEADFRSRAPPSPSFIPQEEMMLPQFPKQHANVARILRKSAHPPDTLASSAEGGSPPGPRARMNSAVAATHATAPMPRETGAEFDDEGGDDGRRIQTTDEILENEEPLYKAMWYNVDQVRPDIGEESFAFCGFEQIWHIILGVLIIGFLTWMVLFFVFFVTY